MIGQNIIKARENAGLSQTELADKIGVSRHLMYKYEHNIITNVPSDKIEAIAAACSVTPAFIMGWEADQENGQQQYYADPEINKLLQEIYENPQLRMVCDGASKLNKDDIEQLIRIIGTFKNGEQNS